VNRAQSCKQHGESIEKQLQQLCNVDATSLVNAFEVAEFLCNEVDQLKNIMELVGLTVFSVNSFS
jgi:predicted transcriptional regulator